MKNGQNTIQLHGVRREFVEGTRIKSVLEDAELSVASGQTVAIRGRSGSGKSTLLNLIAGIDTPTAGRILVCDQCITAMSERDRTLFRRANIGFVYQSFNLIPTLNVENNIRLVLELNKMPRKSVGVRVSDLLASVGLKDRAQSFPDTLSGGEQQRVALARALANRPGVLLADEPTGNLDDDNAEQVMHLLSMLVKAQGTTMLIATHSRAVAEQCDRIVAMAGGKLLEQAYE